VEMSLPHVYASQVEYMSENLKYREFVTLSHHLQAPGHPLRRHPSAHYG